MKAETKGNDEDEQQQPELGDRLEDLKEHDDEDPELNWQLRQVWGQVKPGASYQEWTNWETPTLKIMGVK